MGFWSGLFGAGGTQVAVRNEPTMAALDAYRDPRNPFYARQNPSSPFLDGFTPVLRDPDDNVQANWEMAASRVIHAYQNSGFIKGVIDVSTAQVVGSGLRMSSRPDELALGWNESFRKEFAKKFESAFRAWSRDPRSCDAGARNSFGQQQQAWYWSALGFGEGLALMPLVKRKGASHLTKIKLLPPSRIVDESDGNRLQKGILTGEWGEPLAYKLYRQGDFGFLDTQMVRAYDANGRPNVVHQFMPGIAVSRGMSEVATGMKAYRQFDQYSDANLTKKMIQTIFAAVIKSNLQGLSAFDGLMTEGDNIDDKEALDVAAFGAAKGLWYDGARIDLNAHGRIAHLFPTDELDFVESRAAGDDFDPIARWLWLEIAAAAGVSYESATGDYRGATYSSVRMAGAKEWLGVTRRRDALVVPFCQAAAEAVLEEEIASGRIVVPGGLPAFYDKRSQMGACIWTGPAQPQADDFKTARAHQVLKEIGGTTMAEIHSNYGRDWDDVMEQQQRENEEAEARGLPKPWAPKTLLETDEGMEAELDDMGDSGEKKEAPKKTARTKGASRTPEKDPTDK